MCIVFFFQAEDGIRYLVRSRGLGDVYKRQAPMMAKVFKALNEPVELIISSPANRAQTTASFFAKELNIPTDQIHFNASIYEASVGSLMRIVQALPDHAEHVMLFGHNPGFSELAYYLCDEDPIALSTLSLIHI